MHIITPYNPWTPKKKKTWQEELWEQNQIAELEAQIIAEASSRTLPPNSPDTSVATAGPAMNAAGGAGGAPVAGWFRSQQAAAVPTIDFTITPSYAGVAPFRASFLNMSSPDALNFWTWTWNFNDGTPTATEINPVHTFPNTGTFTVSLTGSSPNGAVVSGSTRLSYASSSRPDMPITVAFSPTQTSGTVPLSVTFQNLTSNYSATTATNGYKWTFSGSVGGFIGTDGALSYPVTTSTVANPTITFYQTGSYSVNLETSGSWDLSGSKYYIMAVSASHPAFTANFTVGSTGTEPAIGVGLTNTTVYGGTGNLQVTWSYGSGSLAYNTIYTSPAYTETPPGVTFINAGIYTASLQITESSYGRRSLFTRSFTV